MGNKMKEWFDANQEIYAEFKSKIHSTLDILSQDGTNVAECDETYSLQNMLLEAMAAYLPVFAIRATGVSDVVVNGENGVLSADSITEWADNLISILKNPAVLIKMRSSARTTALLYDEKSIANQILESYAYLKKSYEAEHWLMMHLNRTSYPVLAKEY